MMRLLTVRLSREEDVVAARQRARQIAQAFGIDGQGQTRLATAVSEISRNAFQYAAGGTVEFSIDQEAGALVICVSDKGPGIPQLQSILNGTYKSRTGMGVGIVGTQRLVDTFAITAAPGQGTVVTLSKALPGRTTPVAPEVVTRVTEQLMRDQPAAAHSEVVEQNHELLAALAELAQRQ